jgi:hypothetical protein
MHLLASRADTFQSLLTVYPIGCCIQAYWFCLRRKCLTRPQEDKISSTQCDEEMTEIYKFSEGQYIVHQLLDFPPYIILRNARGRQITTKGRMRPPKYPVRPVDILRLLLIKEAVICLFLISHHLLYLQLSMRNSSENHSKFDLMGAITPSEH